MTARREGRRASGRWRPWSNEPEPVSTIDDRTWRRLQRRAAHANPQRADPFSEQARHARTAGSANYRNRRMC